MALDRKLRVGTLLITAGVLLMLGSIVAPAASGWPDKAKGYGESAGRGHKNGKTDAVVVTSTSVAIASGGGANHTGPYDPWGVGEPSGNGQGNTGECAGCNGDADGKHPPGQSLDGSDNNRGYECDRNLGIAKTNPAHSGCFVPAATPSTTPSTTVAPPSTTTTAPVESTTTTAPESTTTTDPGGSTTTTVEVGGTNTTLADEVLGVEFERSGPLARTGYDVAVIALLGLVLTSAGLVMLGLRTRIGVT